MEWRQQSSVSCEDAFDEAQRWIEEVTGKSFGCNNFRAALENGVLLCDLINQLKPGIIKRVNRLSTPIAGLDNVNVFLKACGRLGLNESQLFHPGDLQDLSTRVTLRKDESQRRLKNVLITIYWLGRKAQLNTWYDGPQLNFKAFEGLLGLALSKALEEGSNVCVKDENKDRRSSEGEECPDMRSATVNAVDGFESLNTHTSRLPEGCGSDSEAEQVFKMNRKLSAHQNRGYVRSPLLRGEENNAGGSGSPLPRSKSLSDIPMVYSVCKTSNGNGTYTRGRNASPARYWSQNEPKCDVAAKDCEAQWQEDLTKWKNRRRSTKSELFRKSQDREHVFNQMTNGAVTSHVCEPQDGPMKRDSSPWRHSAAPRPYATSLPSKSLSADLRPHTRALLIRSSSTEEPFNSQNQIRGSSLDMTTSDGSALGQKPQFASLASRGARMTTLSLDQPFTSQTQVEALNSQSFHSSAEQARLQSLSTNQTSFLVTVQPRKNAVNQDGVNAAAENLQDLIHKSQEENRASYWGDSAFDGRALSADENSKYLSSAAPWSSSASLPRGYRRSEGSSRISSAITARPFGTNQSRRSSLPRFYSVDDQDLLLKSEKENSPSSPQVSLKRQTAAANLRGQYQASIRQKKANQARQNGSKQREVSTVGFSEQMSLQTSSLPCQSSTQKLSQPSTNLQCSNYKNSASTTLYSKVDYSDMRVSLTLKPNSVPDFGFQTHWDSTGARVKFIQPGSPAELCQLCVNDEIVAVDGAAVAYLTYSQWKERMASSLETGSLTMDIRRYGKKDWSTSSDGHPNQPGQSRKTLNLTAAAPVLIGYTDRHANGVARTETADRQGSKFNWQTDHAVQCKDTDGALSGNFHSSRGKDCINVAKTNQKRRADFFNQTGGSESAISDLQVPSLSLSTSNWLWDREEDRRRQEKWQEEQERLLQEQYQRDQERLEAEWQRAQQDALDGRTSQENTLELPSGPERFTSGLFYVNGLTKKSREDERGPDQDHLKEAELKVQNSRNTENCWAEGSCGFAQLSPAHRAMSLSTQALSEPHKPTRVDQRRFGRSLSKAERERQQILEEMKKRTQLLTDNSWIRQRSNSSHKEPIDVAACMKRYESLDNLDMLRHSPDMAATFTYPRPHSVAGGYGIPTRNAASRYSTGSMSSQRNMYTDSSHLASAWAAADISEEQRREPRSMSETGSPTVITAISYSGPLVLSPCDQDDLQIKE
nr:uncharacterized protein LOC107381152 isoform X1 [Nothobranchius furzeri]XP_054587808.1 uncharacterized protein LOC107381152 isoform X1 [Nothobranchius furzeri]